MFTQFFLWLLQDSNCSYISCVENLFVILLFMQLEVIRLELYIAGICVVSELSFFGFQSHCLICLQTHFFYFLFSSILMRWRKKQFIGKKACVNILISFRLFRGIFQHVYRRSSRVRANQRGYWQKCCKYDEKVLTEILHVALLFLTA